MNVYEITLALQNIYSGNEIWGGEFLCRVYNDSKITPPKDLLKRVRSQGKQYDFDLFFIDMVMQVIQQHPIERAFINIHPESLSERKLPQHIHALSIKNCVSPENIIFEITEESPISEWDTAFSVLHTLKKYGYRIAIDDFGCAYSNLERLIKLYAFVDYIKIDNSVYGNDSILFDDVFLNYLPDRIKGSIIAEGIESLDESSHLTSLGIILHQGYLYHMPTPMGTSRKFLMCGENVQTRNDIYKIQCQP